MRGVAVRAAWTDAPAMRSRRASARRTPASPRSVVVGYNGKRASQVALEWAVGEAARRRVPLRVVYAANYPGMNVAPGPGLLQPDPGALEAAQEVAARGVTEVLTRCSDVQVTGAVEVTGPAEALVEAGNETGLVVVGTRGRAAPLEALLGSVSSAVAARASCPVIVVKGDPENRPVGPDQHVVVGTDGSRHAEQAVAFAADHAAGASATLEVVSCIERDPRDETPDEERLAEATGIVRSAAERVMAVHPELTVRTRVEVRDAARSLIEASRTAGMVVVGTRGRGAFRGWVLGSVGQAVIRGADCPVAVC